MTAKSEKDCLDLLVKEMSSLSDREVPDEAPESAGSQMSALSSEFPRMYRMIWDVDVYAALSRAPAQGTSTNVMIAKTIRAAMADIRPSS